MEAFLKFYLLSILVFIFSISSFADSYGFPDASSAKSTLGAGIIQDHDGFTYTIVKFKSEIHKGRYLKSLKVRFYESQTPSETLVYVMTGIGGNADAGGSNFMASELTKNGYHVIIIPSTFTSEFAESYSEFGYVGLLNRDSLDLLELINQTRTFVENKSIKITSLKMVGYSLGALTAAHVSAQSEKVPLLNNQRDIHFDKVVMINTPVDLIYGLRHLDNSLLYRSKMRIKRYLTVGLSILKTIKAVSGLPLNLDAYQSTLDRFAFISEDEAKLFIATSLSASLGGVVEASQKVFDLGLLPPMPTDGSVIENQERQERASAIAKVSFEEYIEKYVVNFYRDHNRDEEYRQYSVSALNKRVSLYAVADHIKQNSNIYLMTNLDDFLLRGQTDVDYLKSLFGDRATFYPRGGHIGNMWYKNNIDKMLSLLK